MKHNQRCRTKNKRSDECHPKPMFKKSRPKIHFLSIPMDVQQLILSKLTLKEVIRTSIVSSEWRSVCMLYPKLRFDATTMCRSSSIHGSEQHIKEFIQNVNAVLQRHNGEFVEDFELKFEFSSELVIHLDKWVRFIATSQAKKLVLDLVPAKTIGRKDRYLLPHEFLRSGSLRHLHSIQLGFLSIKVPLQLSDLPNLRKLDLHLIDVTAMQLEHMLSKCSNLEWLSIVKCHVNDELKVLHPLPCLQYLCIANCMITRIKFNAMNLKTFVCEGSFYSFDLTQSLELKDAEFVVRTIVPLEYTLVTLPTVLPAVENLSLIVYTSLKSPALLQNSCKFYRLKYLELGMVLDFDEVDNILSLASYLRAAPLIEKLEIHFRVFSFIHSVWDLEPLRSLPRCPNNYLKTIYITGFTACRGQLEFLLHAVENAPMLEVLTLDPACKLYQCRTYEGQASVFSLIRAVSKQYLTSRLLPSTKLCLL